MIRPTSLFICFCTLSLFANPKGVEGPAILSSSNPNTLIVKTDKDKTVLKWKEFSIREGEITKFIQPSSQAATLNRVIGSNASEILGNLESNGHIYLINPNGILVGDGAYINTASFIGSTFDVLESSFLRGENLEFIGESKASVINHGIIHTRDGDALLIAHTAENHGTLTAEGGRAASIGCTYLLYKPQDDSPLYVKGGAANTLETEGNPFSHAMKTNANPDALSVEKVGGEVYLTVSKNSGVIRSTYGDKGGEVYVLGDHVELEENYHIDVSGDLGGGSVFIGGSCQGKDPNLLPSQLTRVAKNGTINANAERKGDGGKVIVWSDKATLYSGHINAKGGLQSGNGGFIEVSTPTPDLHYQGTIDTVSPNGKMGTLLLDPNDIVISGAATSGGFSNPYTGAGFATAQLNDGDLTGALAGANVLVQTSTGTAGGNGDISVTVPLAWVGAGVGNSALTLDADRDININSAITITGTGGGLTFDAGQDLNVTANIAHNAANGGLFSVTTGQDFNLSADVFVGAGGGSGVGATLNIGRNYTSTLGSTIDVRQAGAPINMTVVGSITAGGGIVNSNTSGAAANVNIVAQNGNIVLGSAASTVPVIFGSPNGAVYVEATRGSISCFGGTGSDDVAIIGYYEPVLLTPYSGALTVLARNDITLQSGTGPFSFAGISKHGRNFRDILNNPTTVTAGRNLLIRAGAATDAPGAGIGRFHQIVAAPVNHSGDITVNVGQDCTIFGGDNFSGIGDRGLLLGGAGSIEANLTLNIGRNLMVGHDPTLPAGISGGFIGVFDNQFGITGSHEVVHGFVHINVGNNFIMDGRFGSAFVEFQNDGSNIAAFPPELFVHVGNSLIMLGGPPASATLSSAFDMLELVNGNAHFWALNSIQCINGANGAANLHNKAFNNTNVVSANLGTISVRAGGDIRVAGGAAARTGNIVVDYEATGGFTYIADSSFGLGELWAPQTALVGGVNIFAGTSLGTPSAITGSNGLGAISFDTQLYDTTAIPGSINQLAANGYGGLNPPATGAAPNPITYWSQNGSNTLMSTRDRFADGTPADILNIGTTGNSISFNNQNRGPLYTDPLNPFTADGANITIIAFRDTVISGPSVVNVPPAFSTIPLYAPSGSILVITQNDMTLQNNAVVSASINVDLVCDNQEPSPPGIGPGSFSMDATSIINADTGYIRVYTARQSQNVIDPLAQFISAGVPFFFVPGTVFEDTDQEKWCTYYANGDQGVPFKIFYKPCIETFTQEAMVILTEFLYEESSFNYYLGWPERFYVDYRGKGDLPVGQWRATFDSFNVSPKERYMIRRQDDTRANNNNRTYLSW